MSYYGTVFDMTILVQIRLCQFHYQNGLCRFLLPFTGHTYREARNMVCMMHRGNSKNNTLESKEGVVRVT